MASSFEAWATISILIIWAFVEMARGNRWKRLYHEVLLLKQLAPGISKELDKTRALLVEAVNAWEQDQISPRPIPRTHYMMVEIQQYIESVERGVKHNG